MPKGKGSLQRAGTAHSERRTRVQCNKGMRILGVFRSWRQQLEMQCLKLLTSDPSLCVLYSTPGNLKLDSGYLGRNLPSSWSSLNFIKGKLRKLEFGNQREGLVGSNWNGSPMHNLCCTSWNTGKLFSSPMETTKWTGSTVKVLWLLEGKWLLIRILHG